jgi:uncharacterized delta-60 repeat protein
MKHTICFGNAAKFWGSLGLVFILLISLVTPALAIDYLDPTYGPPNGYVTLEGGYVQTVLQSDDRLLVLNNGVLSRLMPDGSLDTSFGVNGVLNQVFSNRARVAYAPDGNIFVADVCDLVVSYYTEKSVLLTRFLPNGQVDNTYNPVCSSINITDPHLFIDDLLILPNGKALVALFPMIIGDGFFGYSVLAQFDANGYPDTSFSNDGLFYPAVPPEVGGGGLNVSLSKVDILKDGTILLSGSVVDSPFLTRVASILFRLTPDGQYDVSFNGDGKLVTYLSADGYTGPFAVQENGRILTRGYETVSGLSTGVVLGWVSDGSLDPEFGNQGKVTLPEKVEGLVLLLDGSFLAAGLDPDTSNIVIRHFQENGIPDPSFGSGGLITLDGGTFGTVRSFHLQHNGQILIHTETNSVSFVSRLDINLVPHFIFEDVGYAYWAQPWIETLYRSGITSGCNAVPLLFCPEAIVSRSQMAVFLLRGVHGSTYSPPKATGAIFGDVPLGYWAGAWIEQLANEGITGGCGNGNYCPELTVTRDQMAVFLLRAKHGLGYTPPVATGVFADVPTTHWAAPWIEQLAAEGITAGCGGGNYCPGAPVTRAQMAVFLVRTFNLP